MLRAIGTATPARPGGQLPRIGTKPNPPWDGYAAQVAGDLRAAIGRDLLSVILRGSPARATAVIGVSDLNLVAVTSRAVMEVPDSRIIAAPDLVIDTTLVTHDALMDAPGEAWRRFDLAFCAHTIWGQEVVEDLPAPVLDARAVQKLRDAESWLAAWPKDWDAAPDPAGRKRVCARLMKHAVRALFESVMREEGVYSRDIYPCTELAGREYLALRTPIHTAGALVVEPTDDRAEVDAVMATLTPAIRDAEAAFLSEGEKGAKRA